MSIKGYVTSDPAEVQELLAANPRAKVVRTSVEELRKAGQVRVIFNPAVVGSDPDPFEYVVVPYSANEGEASRRFTAGLCCPNGHRAALHGFDINRQNGKVRSMVICSGDGAGCNFEDFVTLKGWAAALSNAQRRARSQYGRRD